jgi:hypothetical protein
MNWFQAFVVVLFEISKETIKAKVDNKDRAVHKVKVVRNKATETLKKENKHTESVLYSYGFFYT